MTDGRVSYDEFMTFEQRAYERLYEKPMDTFERDLAGRRFAILDEDGTGYVNLREFQNHQAMKVLEKKGKVRNTEKGGKSSKKLLSFQCSRLFHIIHLYNACSSLQW